MGGAEVSVGRRGRRGLPGAERGPAPRHRELPPRVPLQGPEPYWSPPVGVVPRQAPLPPRSLRHRSQARSGVSQPDSPPGSPQRAASAARDAAGNQAPRAPASRCCAPFSLSAPNSFRPQLVPPPVPSSRASSWGGSCPRTLPSPPASARLRISPAALRVPHPAPPFCFWPSEAFLLAAKFLFLFLETFIQGLKPFYLPYCFVLLKCSIKKSFSIKLKYREWISKRQGLGLPVLSFFFFLIYIYILLSSMPESESLIFFF